jgi:predicted nucleotidyltransferase component of viral defense system
MAYSSESVVAEKFQAILRLGAANSRMKDFYDIFHIAECKTFELFVLKDAVEKTLENRETELPENLEAFFRIIRSSDELKDFWKGFIRRINKPEYESFDFIIDKIEKFLIPLFTCEDNRQWNNEKWLWE